MERTLSHARVAYPGPPELALVEVEDRYVARGVPARIEPSDLAALTNAIAQGRDVVVSLGGDPAFVIDIADVVTVRAGDGAIVRVNCEELVEAWAEYDQHVVAVGSMVLLPLTLVEDPEDLGVGRADDDHRADPQRPAAVVHSRGHAPTNGRSRQIEHP
jgi:hypothetical protein